MEYLTAAPLSWDLIVMLEQTAGHSLDSDSRDHPPGALVTFLGMVRRERHHNLAVKGLHYEAFTEMAEAEIHRLVRETKTRWSVQSVIVQHRVGFVEVGQVSVVIVVTAPHRKDAYDASQHIIDGIKRDVPIWKREHYSDGSIQWKGCSQQAKPEQESEVVHA